MSRKGNGSTGIVVSPDIAITANFTIAFFYENDSAPSTDANATASWTSTTTDEGFTLNWGHPSAGFRQAVSSWNGSSFDAIQYTTSLVANTRYHLACTYDGTDWRLYLNGALDTGPTTLGAPVDSGTENMNLFSHGQSANFDDGRMGEFGLWNTVLNANEINSLAKGQTPNRMQAANLLIYWRLGVASPEPDWSGNGLNGTISGTTTVVDHEQVRPAFGFDTTLLAAPAAVGGVSLRTLSLLGVGT